LRRIPGRAELIAWVVLALALAGIGTHDAVSRLAADHNSAFDGGYMAMALAWLALAAWASVRGLTALSERVAKRRRRFFVALLLVGSLPYERMLETPAAFGLNVMLLLFALLLLFVRRLALPPSRVLPGDRSSTHAGVEKKSRARFFSQAAGVTPYVAVEVEDALFFVSTNDRKLGRGLFARQSRNDINILDDVLQRLGDRGFTIDGTTFIDVGANIGTTTVTALSRGFGRAVAIEPSPANAQTLRLNLVANRLVEVVVVVEAAAGDREGAVPLAVSSISSGKNRLARGLGLSGEALMVNCVTVDRLAKRGVFDPQRVGLLWIDTQGDEGRVLHGAGSLLKQGVPIVTAVRRGLRHRHDVRVQLERALADYDEFVDLRSDRHETDLRSLLRALDGSSDLLALRY
jgi:FkbM family methyltransferase